jgi:hypothetical protein
MVSPRYTVGPGDGRFLMTGQLASRVPEKLIVVDNWSEELKRNSPK